MIHTVESLRKIHRRLDRRNAAQQRRQVAAARILEAMRQGAVLHRHPQRQRSIWVLNGEFIPHDAALEVLRNPNVVGDDSLFGRALPALSKTFRYQATEESA